MWDLEAFTYPPLVLTSPPAARAMLDYRFDRMAAARSNAKLYGYRGVQFPWQSSAQMGEECTPLFSPSSLYEQHTSLAVALAFAHYDYAVGDERFTRQTAWPVLEGTAEWIASRVQQTRRGCEILHMTGPAETRGPVDNDAFVNMSAVTVLRAAVECARRLGLPAPSAWERIAAGLVIPRDGAMGGIANYDGYAPEQPGGATPSAAAGLFPLGYRADAQTERATLRFYVDLAPKYIGQPMLSAFYGVWAAWLGDRALSARLFEQGYAAFIEQPFNVPGETPEGQPPHAGPFFANLGGFLMGCLFGLPGLRLGSGDPATWCERPVVLPEGWDTIEVERLWVRNQPARLVARHGDERARIEVTGEE